MHCRLDHLPAGHFSGSRAGDRRFGILLRGGNYCLRPPHHDPYKGHNTVADDEKDAAYDGGNQMNTNDLWAITPGEPVHQAASYPPGKTHGDGL